MPNPSFLTPASAPSHPTWAEVRSHDSVMRYQRSGAGPSVVVLQPRDGSSPLWPGLTNALAAAFRVIEPEAPANEPDVARWLADFLEGLGLSGVAVVAAESFCIPTLELALLGTDQVGRAVLVPNGHAGETGLDGSLATSMSDGTVALLVVRRGLGGAEAVPLVARFLAGTGAQLPG